MTITFMRRPWFAWWPVRIGCLGDRKRIWLQWVDRVQITSGRYQGVTFYQQLARPAISEFQRLMRMLDESEVGITACMRDTLRIAELLAGCDRILVDHPEIASLVEANYRFLEGAFRGFEPYLVASCYAGVIAIRDEPTAVAIDILKRRVDELRYELELVKEAEALSNYALDGEVTDVFDQRLPPVIEELGEDVERVQAEWRAHAYPLKQITICLQGTRWSDKNRIINQLEGITERLRSGDIEGHDHDDDFGYSFAFIADGDASFFANECGSK